eukprot:gb/GFBE01077845.1/.p1 GENE.gb/GFBE01077845.1/~~gb/GFBE01077845.1/.p1  ORF type:complete len:334 (+),score=120.72 gb/GFBE01077845.1/:1-1002(+)
MAPSRAARFALALLAGVQASQLAAFGSEACHEQEVEYAEEQVSDLQVSLLQTAPGHLLQLSRARAPSQGEAEEAAFAWDQIAAAVYIDDIKERIDLGDVKEHLLTELTRWQKQCPDADEIKFQMGDLWAEVGDVVRADGIKAGIAEQQRKIDEAKATTKNDAAQSAAKVKQLEESFANATKIFSKDQVGRLSDIVSTREEMSDVKKTESSENLTPLDQEAVEDKYKMLEKKYADLTKDMNDNEIQQAFAAVVIKQDLEAVKRTLTDDYQAGEIKARTEVFEYKKSVLQQEYDAAVKDLNLPAVKEGAMKIWHRSLKDLPDMEDLRKSFESRKR